MLPGRLQEQQGGPSGWSRERRRGAGIGYHAVGHCKDWLLYQGLRGQEPWPGEVISKSIRYSVHAEGASRCAEAGASSAYLKATGRKPPAYIGSQGGTPVVEEAGVQWYAKGGDCSGKLAQKQSLHMGAGGGSEDAGQGPEGRAV